LSSQRGVRAANVLMLSVGSILNYCCAMQPQVVVFGKGSGAGFPFGKAAVTLKNSALPGGGNGSAGHYITISGSLGSTSVTAVTQQAGGGGGKAKRTVKGISFPAGAVADGKAGISKGFGLAPSYGDNVVVVP
jgi:hypothetical protein